MDEKKPVFHLDQDIQNKLKKKLGPEFVSKRIGFGKNKVAYVEGWKVINLANQIFGYNGWSTDVKSVTVDFLDERQGKYSIGCSAIIRVSLANGSYREDVGYGTSENERRKGVAFENAKKTAVTDALKRAMRCYGNALGNCFYDKDFLSKIDKMKYDPPDIEEANLYRASDEYPERSRATTKEVPDENIDQPNKRRQLTKIEGPNESSNANMPVRANNKVTAAISTPVAIQTKNTHPINIPIDGNLNSTNDANANLDLDHEDLLDDSFTMSDDFQDEDLLNMSNSRVEAKLVPQESTDGKDLNPIGFVTAKGAISVQKNKDVIPSDNVFDPKYQARSIKHTIDQTTSKHVPVAGANQKKQSGSRDSVYEKFAAKGKQLEITESASTKTSDTADASPRTSVTASETNINSGVSSELDKPLIGNNNNIPEQQKQSESVTPKFAPPSKVVHPNNYVLAPNSVRSSRREVGRPKVNPLHLKRTNP
ncbi:similar to Saccharomyces cerevisiae YML032C RAD52 Protein that stimulates strand exchange by facilitating Rad51p binding to single-stranded DNA [Maudiozyma barnettii]|uniref:DNA repair and recombination protein RAD52 n=1 Tax=Maudiozyma barnettii TaxID=61262 RepID=A0A8H2ZLP8_9SACH|nr:recombinase RAD52 [Kazachstania barnettii]CAB4256327.1 similar to Saccharomyces cerevisiae YML032C RAD52 Protein that stimulates strand exchange by facilitating Rad51p binding to single-stranded DNA [Kazachstania barnettii]CAD1784936.1 similar to Saccharomyces cerevisiae YML032C RAD52 Protein that stimulates strand exchange by facilitating Rad51p binding to single-stranded DNA [Kazachstania barnettii]